MGREYPSVRKALLGKSENGVANLWCGVKWIIWQLTYVGIGLFIAALGVILLPVVLAGKFLQGGRTERFGTWLGEKLYNFATHDYVSKAFRWTFVALVILSFVSAGGWLIYGLMSFPEKTLIMLGFVTLVILSFASILLFAHVLQFGYTLLSDRFSSVQDRSKEKPVTRRLIGHCPVSMDLTPRWFQKIFEP